MHTVTSYLYSLVYITLHNCCIIIVSQVYELLVIIGDVYGLIRMFLCNTVTNF